jgi:hypothetical protein
MYITNRPEVARIAEEAGVERIFVDMEYIGKSYRQGGMDTVQSRHTTADVALLRSTLTRAELLVRCNPIHEATEAYGSSEDELNAIVEAGADVIMLPYFKTAEEVRSFVRLVDGRARTMLLFETPESVAAAEEILAVEGIDEVFIGLNDLSLGYGMKFMFRLVADGTVERLCRLFADKGIPYGFGGIAALGKGMLPCEYVIKEHYRVGSGCAILSRSFCNTQIITDLPEIRRIFTEGLRDIRAFEETCLASPETWETNRRELCEIVDRIEDGMPAREVTARK